MRRGIAETPGAERCNDLFARRLNGFLWPAERCRDDEPFEVGVFLELFLRTGVKPKRVSRIKLYRGARRDVWSSCEIRGVNYKLFFFFFYFWEICFPVFYFFIIVMIPWRFSRTSTNAPRLQVNFI